MVRKTNAISVKLNSSTRTYLFKNRFVIGRSPECDVVVNDSTVSAVHATVVPDKDRWIFTDEGSTNGSFIDGVQRTEAVLESKSSIRLGGVGGPLVSFVVESLETNPRAAPALEGTRIGFPSSGPPARPTKVESEPTRDNTATRSGGRSNGDRETHLKYERHLQERLRAQRRGFVVLIGVVMGFVLILFAYIGFQFVENSGLHDSATDLFYLMRGADRDLAEVSAIIEESGNADLSAQLENLRRQRAQQQSMYAGYVRELGTYRKLDAEERLIYQTARAFNECEFEIPKGFLDAVKREIRNTWGGPGRQEWQRAVARAESSGFTRGIVERMQRYGLPTEFFYLALQESRFDRFAVGPSTRYGRAKGMWQFIPGTAEAYGLVPVFKGRAANPVDARHDFDRSTAAATRYLSDIYVKLAQASGLLAMASYNWGEHRVISKMKELYGDLPDNTRDRSYWAFLSRYGSRMPAETKDYVLKIFAAAVVGSNPRMFGIEMDDPLAKYRRSSQIAGS